MANAIYPKYKEALISGSTDVALSTGTVKVSLVDFQTQGTVYDPTHQYYSDISSFVISTATITNTTVTNGVFDGDDVSFIAVTGAESEALIIWIDTGTPTTSRLVAFLDTGVTGLPITPSGGNIDVEWNASGIFAI